VTSAARNTPTRSDWNGRSGGTLGVCSSGGGPEPVRVHVAAQLLAIVATSAWRPSPAGAGWYGRC
jgi:hypothetical protein